MSIAIDFSSFPKLRQPFGSIDGDQDQLLKDAFSKHTALVEVLHQGKWCVLGRKGAGKTALYRQLLEIREDSRQTTGYSFSDYPWEYHGAQVQEELPSEEKYVKSWKYFILLQLAKLVLKDEHYYNHADQQMYVKIKNFVEDTYGSSNPDPQTIFVPDTKIRLKQLDIGPRFMKGSIDSIDLSSLPKHFSEVNRVIEEALFDCLDRNVSYFILFDGLDVSADIQDGEYLNRVIGLLRAAKQTAESARARGLTVQPTVFLRDDIFSALRFQDKNKISRASSVTLVWDDSQPDRSLKHLMENRFRLVLGGEHRVPVAWEDLFDAQKISSTRDKYGYIRDRTFRRPRDFIQYLNEVAAHSKSFPFTNDDVLGARSRYSAYFLDELRDEVHTHTLGDRLEDFLEILRANRKTKIDRKTFEEVASDRRMSLQDTEDALKFLIQFSVLGIYRSGGSGGGSGYKFKFEEPDLVLYPHDSKFRVHWGFKEVLDLVN